MAKADSAGNFRLQLPGPGRYAVFASGRDHVKTYFGQRAPLDLFRTIDMTGEADRTVIISLYCGSTVRGTVQAAPGMSPPFVISAEPVAELPDTSLVVEGIRTDDLLLRTVTQISDAEGAFEIHGLRPGAYRLSAQSRVKNDDATVQEMTVPTYLGDTLSKAEAGILILAEGQTAETKIAAITPKRIKLSGKVQGGESSNFRDTSVRILRQDEAGNVTNAVVTRADRTGHFEARVPPRGTYLIAATVGRPWLRPGVQSSVRAGFARITVADTNRTDLAINTSAGFSVVGRIVRAISDEPMNSLRVAAAVAKGSAEAATVPGSAAVSHDGTFRLQNLFGCERFVVASSRGQHTVISQKQLGADEGADQICGSPNAVLNIELSIGSFGSIHGSIEGRVAPAVVALTATEPSTGVSSRRTLWVHQFSSRRLF